MQASSDNQCTPQKPVDGGWNDERSTVQGKDELVHTEVPNVAHRTVCLSASLSGKGGASV